MKKIIATFCFFFIVLIAPINAQNLSPKIQDYVEKYKTIAVQEMNRVGIPASITLAQGILESNFGTSYLASKTNNHFGIKCHENWTGKTFRYTDDAPNECFRVYENIEQSYIDHSDFLKNRNRYASLFNLENNDYKNWAYGLKKAGYATNPKYAEILLKYIEDYQLYKYDNNTTETKQNITKNTETEKEVDKNEIKTIEKTNNTTEKLEEKMAMVNNVPLIKGNKQVYIINKKKAIKVSKSETIAMLAKKLNIAKSDLLIWNDLEDENFDIKYSYLFIEPKLTANKKEKKYIVKWNDNLWKIAQKNGIQLQSLRTKNKLEIGEEPAKNEILFLKKNNKHKPKLRKIESTKIIIIPKIDTLKIDKISITKDTIYPTNTDSIATNINQNKLLDFENDTKLLEKNNLEIFKNKDTTQTIIFDTKKEEIIPTKIENKNTDKSENLPSANSKKNIKHTIVKGDTMYNISKKYNCTISDIQKWNNMQDLNPKLGQILIINP